MTKNMNILSRGLPRIAYVRPVKVADLPTELQNQMPDARDLHAVHSEDGERLALVDGRQLAFMLARQNNLSPVNVH